MEEIVIENEQDDDLSSQLEEAHYFHTINDLVELMVVYGSAKVLGDLWKATGEIKT